MTNFDKSVCIVGGGFYGVIIAIYLKRFIGLKNVEILEQESKLISKASFKNQARVHNGYHYPRSFITAYRSRQNFAQFINDFKNCIYTEFSNFYAIARRNSKISSYQFERFCLDVGIPYQKLNGEIKNLFNPALISEVYKVQEYAFDASKLREWSYEKLRELDIPVSLNKKVIEVKLNQSNEIEVISKDKSDNLKSSNYTFVFNCTYSGLSQIDPSHNSSSIRLKHEIAELALVDPPHQILNNGITVLDGPFFSLMPFPSKNCYCLTHVRYTPHSSWIDQVGLSPYEVISKKQLFTRFDRMIRDASRFLPLISNCKYRESLFEVKTVLEKNEFDDGRPILLRESRNISRFYSVLGGKIDNVYDILKSLDNIEDLFL